VGLRGIEPLNASWESATTARTLLAPPIQSSPEQPRSPGFNVADPFDVCDWAWLPPSLDSALSSEVVVDSHRSSSLVTD